MTSLCSNTVFCPTLRWHILVHKQSENRLIAQVIHQKLLSIYGQNDCSHWPNIFLNMSGRGWRMDVRIAHTVAYLLRCPWSSVPEAMRACKFFLDESASQLKQMTIRRSFAKKATGGKLVPPPPLNVIDTATAVRTTVSPLTMSTVRGGTPKPTARSHLTWKGFTSM